MQTTVQGGEQFVGQFTRLKGAGPTAMLHFITEITTEVHGTAVRGIQRGPASGRMYKSSVSAAQHQASAMGEYPMSDSGTLARSVVLIPPTNKTKPVGIVGTNLDYGAILELKAPSRGGRPWLSRALKTVMRRGTDKILERVFKRLAK
jgi:hypothetical protein